MTHRTFTQRLFVLLALTIALVILAAVAFTAASEARPTGVSPRLDQLRGENAPDWVATVRPYGFRHLPKAIHASDVQCFDLRGRSMKQETDGDVMWWAQRGRARVAWDRTDQDFVSMTGHTTICAAWTGR